MNRNEIFKNALAQLKILVDEHHQQMDDTELLDRLTLISEMEDVVRMDLIKTFSNVMLNEIVNEGLEWSKMNLDQQYHSLSYRTLSMMKEHGLDYDIEQLRKFANEELNKRIK